MKEVFVIISVILCCVLFAGCSAPKFGYDQMFPTDNIGIFTASIPNNIKVLIVQGFDGQYWHTLNFEVYFRGAEKQISIKWDYNAMVVKQIRIRGN